MENEEQNKKTKLQLERLMALWTEAREEVRQRITQRDNYFVRMILILAAIMVAVGKVHVIFMMAIPAVALYFAILTSRSYDIHRTLAKYIREELETKILKMLYTEDDEQHLEYETMFKQQDRVAVRVNINQITLYIISILTLLAVLFVSSSIMERGLVWVSCIVSIRVWDKWFVDNGNVLTLLKQVLVLFKPGK